VILKKAYFLKDFKIFEEDTYLPLFGILFLKIEG
jgi:hypothetical protein